MSITSTEAELLRSIAKSFAMNNRMYNHEVVIPQQSYDWGWDFHPDYHEMVNTVEIHTTKGCCVLVVNDDYKVIDDHFMTFSYDF
jgi:hypothetical protein